jgi:phosphopantothenoylcysteine decarboxylase/phosphopantothenate--cysteine ligase
MHPSKELWCSKSEKLVKKKIVLGITGSIAACETVKLARELLRHGAEVYPVMTSAAQKIIHPNALEFACGNTTITEIDGKVQHVALCGEVDDRADLLLIAPSTANTISKIAYGIDDTTVTTFATTAIGSKIPVIIVPAMHISMYNHPVVMENIEKLKSIGISVLEPNFEEHKAKMPSIEEIVAFVIRAIGKSNLLGKKTLVIAGSTAEAIDDMRVITNRSSGRTGVELAKNAFERGAEVELWMGQCEVELPGYIPITRFESTKELSKMTDNIDHDIVIVPAAISDYSPDRTKGKIPSGKEETDLKLKPNPKIIQKIRKKSHCILVGFKAEFEISEDDLLSRAKVRMRESDLDLIVANDISKTTQEENHVYIIGKDSVNEVVSGRKEVISERILDRVVGLC